MLFQLANRVYKLCVYTQRWPIMSTDEHNRVPVWFSRNRNRRAVPKILEPEPESIVSVLNILESEPEPPVPVPLPNTHFQKNYKIILSKN